MPRAWKKVKRKEEFEWRERGEGMSSARQSLATRQPWEGLGVGWVPTNPRTRAKSQWIVAQRLLSALTIPGPIWVVYKWFKRSTVGNYDYVLDFWQSSHMECNQAEAYTLSSVLGTLRQHCLSSMDSDLEAFSRNPTDDGIAVLAFQLAAITKYLNEVFLSYWLRLLSQRLFRQ